MTIQELTKKHRGALDYLDLEILIAHSLGKTREFVLIHPEYKLTTSKISKLESQIKRRAEGEPIAYIIGHKEFYGLDFIVNKHTLVPRPETELIVEQTLDLLRSMLRSKSNIVITDIGTGSGCIIISIAKTIENLKSQISNLKFIGVDISADALKIAKKNARRNGVDKKIKFLHGSLLEPLLKNNKLEKLKADQLIITANLPYLSKEIYQSAPVDVNKFEPKSALYSPEEGLQHYRKLLEQLKGLMIDSHWSLVTVLLEISPEQKQPIAKLIKSIFPDSKTEFTKDLAGKWRICKAQL